MKIEKINDRQIRCILTKEDLEDRKIRLSELVCGGEKARGLLRDMMTRAAHPTAIPAADMIEMMLITLCDFFAKR